MRTSGRKPRGVFDRYNIVSAGDLRAAAERLSSPQQMALERPLRNDQFVEAINESRTLDQNIQ